MRRQRIITCSHRAVERLRLFDDNYRQYVDRPEGRYELPIYVDKEGKGHQWFVHVTRFPGTRAGIPSRIHLDVW